jgi:hypothetical protein
MTAAVRRPTRIDSASSAGIVPALLVAVLFGLPAPTVQASAEPASRVSSSPAAAPSPHPRMATRMKRQWGVEVIGVKQTAAGYMLEFRYRVIDPLKAKPLFERKTKPALVHETSGSRFVVPTPPKTGALRNSNPPLAGHTYWMFFANPGGYVKPGERVSVVIGDFRADGLVVQ